MQPRTLEQIITELNTSYNPQIETIRKQQALIPQQTEAAIQAAGAAQNQAYEDILTGARRRGLGFAGIPLGEQAKYASTVYAPAVLQARTGGQQQALSLEQSLNQLVAQRAQQAEQIRQYEMDMAERQRQFNEQLAASRAAAAASGGGYSFGGGGGEGGGGGVVTPAQTGATFEKYKQNIANDTVNMFNIAKAQNNFTSIQNTINSINSQLQKPNLSAEAKNRLNYQLSAIQQVAQQYNIDLNKLKPSRAQSIIANPIVQTAKQTAPFLFAPYAAYRAGVNVKDWLFGAR